MSVGRRVLLLSASAVLHVAAVGAALVIAGPGQGPLLFVDLASVDLTAGPEGAGSGPSPPAAARPAPAPSHDSRPVRKIVARAAQPPATAVPLAAPEPAEVTPAPSALPKFELSREAAPSESAAPAAAPPAPTAGPGVAAAETGSAAPRAGGPGVMGEGGGLGGVSGGALLALAVPGDGRSGVPAEYGPFLARFRQRIQEALVYPLAARRQGLSGTVGLEVLVEPSGQIRSVRLVSSSSHAVLDDAALDAVRGLAPLPLPEHLPRRPLKIRLPVVFHLR